MIAAILGFVRGDLAEYVEPKERTPHAWTFRYFGLLLAFVGAAALTFGLYSIAASVGDPIVRTHTVEIPQPALTAAATVADAKSRYASPAIPGPQLGLPDACEGHQLKDGIGIVCHGG